MSKTKEFIDALIKEKKHYKQLAKHYKQLYFGLVPPTHIHIKREDWIKILEERESLEQELRRHLDN